MDEAKYREQIQNIYNTIEKAFDNVDPDVAECEQAAGAMTIKLSSGDTCVLSAQPSVKQLWLAVTSRAAAHHFNFDQSSGRWLDDKNQGIELIKFLRSYFKETINLDLF